MDHVIPDTDVASEIFRQRLTGPLAARLTRPTVAAAQRRGRIPPVNDSWIAAHCLVHGISLATLNAKTSSTSLTTKA